MLVPPSFGPPRCPSTGSTVSSVDPAGLDELEAGTVGIAPEQRAQRRDARAHLEVRGRRVARHTRVPERGVVVIDVGTNRIDDPTAERGYRWVGDVDYESASAVAGAITKVPGGVGPMTITMLLKNTVKAAWAIAGS